MSTDAELLRRYATEKSEAAFAELVHRHVALVYSTALRQLGGDVHFAQDVTQTVFTALARKAAALMHRGALAGWLYLGAHHAAAQIARTEQRRRAREQEAHTMHELTSPAAPPTDWDRVRPVLDEALRELRDDDREAVLLRFFERRPFADIGAALNVTEDAARMRTERALDKLHAQLTKRGITSTSAALSVAIANQAMVAAPSGLANAVAGTALASVAPGAGALGSTTISMKTITLAASALAVIAVGFALRERGQREAAEQARTAIGTELEGVRARMRDAEQRADSAAQQATAVRTEMEMLRTAPRAAAPARSGGTSSGFFYLGGSGEAETSPRGTTLAEAMSNIYAALFRQLGFTPDQRAQFVALMVEWKERGNALFTTASTTGTAGSTPPTGEQERENLRRIIEPANIERDAKMRALFGEGVLLSFQDYEAKSSLRSVTTKLASQLFHTDAPLSPPQSDQLVAIMAANARTAAGKIDLLAMNNDAVLAQAQGVLSESQLAAFRRVAEQAQAQEQFSRQRAKPVPPGN